MNRFRRKKETRDASEGSWSLSTESEPLNLLLPMKAFRLGKRNTEPEPKTEIDLTTALPSSDNFRTSLLMSGLSARFSMLREQDNPNTKIGKASDDSVMAPQRVSRLNDLSFQSYGLSNISEVSSLRGLHQAPHEIERAISNASLPCYDSQKDTYSQYNIMNRSRPGEGNNLFGGRQKINVGNRVLYDDDVRLSAYQRQRRSARSRKWQEGEHHHNQSLDRPEMSDSVPNCHQIRSSSSSENQSISLTTTTTFPEESREKQKNFSVNTRNSQDRQTSKIRKLYETGLDNHLHKQQHSTMTKIDTLTRRSGTTNLPSPGPSTIKTCSNQNMNNLQPSARINTSYRGSASTENSVSSKSCRDEMNNSLRSPLTHIDGQQPIPLQPNDSLEALFRKDQMNILSHDEESINQEPEKINDQHIPIVSKSPKTTSLTDFLNVHKQVDSNLTDASTRSDSDSSTHRKIMSRHHDDLTQNHHKQFSASSKGSYQSTSKTLSSYKDSSSILSSSSTSVNEITVRSPSRSESRIPLSTNFKDDTKVQKDLGRDQSIKVLEATDNLSKSNLSTRLKNLVGNVGTNYDSPTQIIGMVRQHMRYESNASSIYEALPSSENSRPTIDYTSAYSSHDYQIQANPWKNQNDEDKIAVLPREYDQNILRLDKDLKSSNPTAYVANSGFEGETKKNQSLESKDVNNDRAKPHDDNLFLSATKYNDTPSYSLVEILNESSNRKLPRSIHERQDSTDTQTEQQNLKNELASRRQHVQQKMKSFVESDNHSSFPIPVPEIPKDGSSKNGVFKKLRTKNSWTSVKPSKENRSKAIKKLGIGNVTSNIGTSLRYPSEEEDNDREILTTRSTKEAILLAKMSTRQAYHDPQFENESLLEINHGRCKNEAHPSLSPMTSAEEQFSPTRIESPFRSLRRSDFREEDKISVIHSQFSTLKNTDYQNGINVKPSQKSRQGDLDGDMSNIPVSRLRISEDNSLDSLSITNKSCPEFSSVYELSGAASIGPGVYNNIPSNSLYNHKETTPKCTNIHNSQKFTPHLTHYTSSFISNHSNNWSSQEDLELYSDLTSQTPASHTTSEKMTLTSGISNASQSSTSSSGPRWHQTLSRFQSAYMRKSDENPQVPNLKNVEGSKNYSTSTKRHFEPIKHKVGSLTDWQYM